MPQSVTLAAGWIPSLSGLGVDIKDLIFNIVIPAMCGGFVVFVGWKAKAPGPTIMACILAAIVWGLSANMDALQEKTAEDITQYDGNTLTPPGGDQ